MSDATSRRHGATGTGVVFLGAVLLLAGWNPFSKTKMITPNEHPKAVSTVVSSPKDSTAHKDLNTAVATGVINTLFSKDDPETQDEDMLADYLRTNFSCLVHLENLCLRNKGYEVHDYQKDGTGRAVFLEDPARVVIRQKDGTDVTLFSYVAPSVKKRMAKEAKEREKAKAAEQAAGGEKPPAADAQEPPEPEKK